MTHTVLLGGAELLERARTEILTSDALAFITELHRRFDPERRRLLAARAAHQARLAGGATLAFLSGDGEARSGDWQVAPPRADYADRRTEITGPTDRKLVINALNSGARGFMADFEDANSPTWANQIEGQLNLRDAVDRTIDYTSADGRHYTLNDETATLLVRPRGLHLPERHLAIDDESVAGAFLDFGLSIFHLGHRLLDAGSAPYYYLPKLEHHLEARLWSDVFNWAESALSIPAGSIRATVLIETLPAAFQMEEMLFELRDRSYGLNAGRWDYIFSMIKCFRDRPEYVLPDRVDVRMTVPFMQAYTSLLVATCHRRGAFAMGGMAAVIPSRTDEAANERAFAGVRADKHREATNGFDGTWVAHPDLVEVAVAEFDAVLGDAPNQIGRAVAPVEVTATDLLDAGATPGEITEDGVRNNVSVAFQYLSFWLAGRGAAAINHLMEDAATAEISRSQLWQWIRHGAQLSDGRRITRAFVSELLTQETDRIRETVGEATWQAGRPSETKALFEQLVLTDAFPEFLTLSAYELID
jgi:malate synthase